MRVNTAWDVDIRNGKIKEMLLGKEEHFFMPEDGKSGVSNIGKYRWLHDRMFMLGRIIEYYDDTNSHGELCQSLKKAIDDLMIEDPLIALDTISALLGTILYSEPERTQVDYRKIYADMHKFLKDRFSDLNRLPELNFNVPDDYPTILSKVKASVMRYFELLDERYFGHVSGK